MELQVSWPGNLGTVFEAQSVEFLRAKKSG